MTRTAPLWTWLVPLLALGALLLAVAAGVGPVLAAVCAVALAAGVFVAVHHAEVVAHRVVEPSAPLSLPWQLLPSSPHSSCP